MNGWKLISIIVTIILILETSFIFWAWQLGSEQINNDLECSINICDGYGSYFYDNYEKICYCYEDGAVAYQEFVK